MRSEKKQAHKTSWENRKNADLDQKNAYLDKKEAVKTKTGAILFNKPEAEIAPKLSQINANKAQRDKNKQFRSKSKQALAYQKRKDELKGKFAQGEKAELPKRQARKIGQTERLKKELFTKEPERPLSSKSTKRDQRIKTANAKQGIYVSDKVNELTKEMPKSSPKASDVKASPLSRPSRKTNLTTKPQNIKTKPKKPIFKKRK
jgi:hypothetical protein